jgi:thiamine-phosphate pyrophosphorylase
VSRTALPNPPLLVISDRRQLRRPIEDVALSLFAGGCRWLSLREKDLPPGKRRLILERLVALGRPFGAIVTAHEDIEAVAATGADGVHLPGGADPAAARARLPRGLIGASAHSAKEASALLVAGADYVTLSPIFASESKPGYGPALGLDALAHAARETPGPILALGGIGPENAASAFAAGASGIAVMGAVMRAEDPQEMVERLLRAMAGR